MQTTILQTNLPSFPWNVGDPLDAVPLNNAFIALQNQINNLINQINILSDQTASSGLGFAMTVGWGGQSTPSAGPYELMGTAPYDLTIVHMDSSVGTAGGSFDVTIFNNGSPIPGLTGITIDQFVKTNVIALSNNKVLKGTELTMQVSNVVAFPMNSWICLNGQTSAVLEPTQGVGTGTANGVSMALAAATVTMIGQGFAFASGVSTTNGIGMTAWQAPALALGTSTAIGVGVASSQGNRVGTATGTSTAQAVGVGQTVEPTLVMDDPNIGVLNENPLG